MKLKRLITYKLTNLQFFSFIFLLNLLMFIITDKVGGFPGRFSLEAAEPMTWLEIYKNAPKTLLASLILSLILLYVYIQGEKVRVKNSANAKQHVADRLNNCSAPNTHECRVCGCYVEDYPWGEDGKSPDFDLCPCCGVQFGVGDILQKDILKRREILKNKEFKWFDENKRPEDWNINQQLKKIPSP